MTSTPPPAQVPRPPTPPPLHRWPQAVRSAALLRGTAVRCGPGLRLVSWPETPTVRAAALGEVLYAPRIAVHLTAAWIWGVASDPGDLLEFAVSRGRVQGIAPAEGVVLHQYRFSAGEVTLLGPFATTSPARTLYDLLRAETFEAPHRFACRLLLAHATLGRERFISDLPARRRAHTHRLLQRLESL